MTSSRQLAKLAQRFAIDDSVTPTAGQGMIFDSVSGLWKPGTVSSGGGGSGGGAMDVLQRIELSSTVAQVDLTAFNNTLYDDYLIEISGLTLTAAGVLQARFSADAGATFDSSAVYDFSIFYVGSGNSTAAGSNTNQTAVSLGTYPSGTATSSYSLLVRLGNLASTTNYKSLLGDQTSLNSDGQLYRSMFGGRYRSTTPVNAIRLVPITGSITGGVFKLLGSRKTVSGSSIGAGGDVALLQSTTATNAANVDFTAFDSTLYDDYFITMDNVNFSADARLRGYLSTNGGGTWDTGTNYDNQIMLNGAANALNGYGFLWFTGMNKAGATYGVMGRLELSTPSTTTLYKTFRYIGTGYDNSGTPALNTVDASSVWKNTAAYNAIRLFCDSGTMSGTFKLFGRRKVSVGSGAAGSSPNINWVSAPTYPTAANFTLVKDATVTASLINKSRGVVLSVLGAGATDRNVLLEQNTPGATWVMTSLLVHSGGLGRNYMTLGLYAKDNSTGKIHTFAFGGSGGKSIRPMRWTNITTYSSNNDFSFDFPAGPCWHKLELDATNLTYSISTDGETFTQVYQIAKNAWLGTIDRAGVWFGVNQQSAPQNNTENVLVMSFSLA